VLTAEVLAKALSSQTPEPTVRNDTARFRTRRVWMADSVPEDEGDWLEWRRPSDEDADDLLACYGDRESRGANSRRETPGARLCWTCWLPRHFSEECPVVPEHLRPEIAARKQKALTELRRKRADRSRNRELGWYQSRADPLPVQESPKTAVMATESETMHLSKKEDGGEPRPH
jgi:hypothetical protein